MRTGCAFRKNMIQELSFSLKDGSCTIYLSTCGKNDHEVSKELVNFLKYVRADLDDSMADFEDDFVRRIQETVRKIKESREMEERYMLLEELLKTERSEGKAEGKLECIFDLLEVLGTVPDELRRSLESETDMDKLNSWHRIAARAESVEQFIEEIQ